MALNKKTIDPAKLTEYERVRRDFVRRSFTDKVLKDRFGLLPRYASFVREYALTGNARNSAKLAGFSPKTSDKNAAKILRKCAPAVDAIGRELETVSDGVKISLREHLTASLLDILDNRNEAPAPAVMAARVLVDLYQLNYFEPSDNGGTAEKLELTEEQKDEVLRRYGVLPPPEEIAAFMDRQNTLDEIQKSAEKLMTC